MTTRERIIDTALGLFNERGTKAITTNHIAEAAGISPGNLYYHFRNKEDVIRAIVSRMVTFVETKTTYGSGGFVKPSLDHLEALFKELLTIQWDYRFFFLELNSVLTRDKKLKSFFSSIQAKRIREIKKSIRAFIEKGIVRPIGERTIDFLGKSIWMYSLFWHAYLDAGEEKITITRLGEGVRMIRNLLGPYLEDPAFKKSTTV